jgi:glycosyltransferase involved in cell wall biosynthesis
MKLFVITHAYAGDGASQMLHSAASYWTQQLGWKVDAVLVPNMSAEANEAVSSSGMHPVWRAQFQEGYDFALINCLHNITFVDLVYPHVPIVLWAHEAETILKSNVSRKQWKSWFSKISLLVFQTDWQYRLYKKYLPDVHQTQVAIIPNGIPLVPVMPRERKAQDNVFRIACVGKLAPMKAQSDLIHAVVSLADRCRIHCNLIGDTGDISSLAVSAQEMIAQYPGLFTLSGYLPRRQALETVAQSDIFCFPSVSESFGLAPLEAALLGIPVILADLPPYRLMGWVSEENCQMFPPGNQKKLAIAVEALMGDRILREKIAQGGKALAERYTINKCLTQLSDRILEFVSDTHLHIA